MATQFWIASSAFGLLAMTAERSVHEQPAVYMMTNQRNGTLYTGVTSNLPKRAFEHRAGTVPGFTKRYGCKTLVWFEVHETMENAIMREKQIKAGSRQDKLALIEALNPEWRDLFDELM